MMLSQKLNSWEESTRSFPVELYECIYLFVVGEQHQSVRTPKLESAVAKYIFFVLLFIYKGAELILRMTVGAHSWCSWLGDWILKCHIKPQFAMFCSTCPRASVCWFLFVLHNWPRKQRFIKVTQAFSVPFTPAVAR